MLNTAKSTVSSSTKSTVVTSGLIQFLSNASASQLWSVLNNQQVVVTYPLIDKLIFPNNVVTINQALIEIANFELIDVEILNGWLLGERDDLESVNEPYNEKWSETGFESQLVVENMGLPLWVIYFNLACFPLFALAICLHKSCNNVKCIAKCRRRLEARLVWNGCIRLFMQFYADMVISSLLNMLTADWENTSSVVKYSNALAVVFLALAAIVPVTLVYHFIKNWQRVREKEFIEKYGTFVDGLNLSKEANKTKCGLLNVPILFLLRRVAFTLSIFFLKKYLWTQLLVQTLFSVGIFSLYQRYRPHDSLTALRIESFNEVTVIALNDLLYCFTDFVPRAQQRSELGFWYIGAVFVNLAVHLALLIYSSLIALRRLVLRQCLRFQCVRQRLRRMRAIKTQHCESKQTEPDPAPADANQ